MIGATTTQKITSTWTTSTNQDARPLALRPTACSSPLHATRTKRWPPHDVNISVLLLFCCAAVSSVAAFLPASHHHQRRKPLAHDFRGSSSSSSSTLFVATEPTIATLTDEDDKDNNENAKSSLHKFLLDTPVFPGSTKPSSSSPPPSPKLRLQLSPDGSLRYGDTVLLDGLSSSTWTGIEPSAQADYLVDPMASSIFLKATHVEEFSEQEFSLGHLRACHRLLACARVNRYWMGPAFGTCEKDIPLDTQFLLVELKEGGPYALMLPMVDAGFRATLQSATKNHLQVACFSESGDKSLSTDGMLALHVSVGADPFLLLKQAFRQVADGTGAFQTLDRKEIPASVDDFGWCTWDAFYSKVTPEGILEGVSTLKELGVPPRNVILDDGWQEVGPTPRSWLNETDSDGIHQPRSAIFLLTGPIINRATRAVTSYYTAKVQRAAYGSFHNRVWTFLARTVLKQGLWTFFDTETDFARQLNGFEPNFKFEKKAHGLTVKDQEISSLKDMVDRLKIDLNVKNVYCWHALHGYWRGISKELGNQIGIDTLQVKPKASKHLLSLDPQAEFDPPSLFGVGMITKEEDLKTFYKHIHAPLVEAGIDGVKVDVQSGVTAAGSGVGGGPRIARLYTQAMEESVSKNFRPDDHEGSAINCINCMCHSTENLYRYQKTSVARASEDFFPDRPESHSVHLVNVAYNSLFIGEICLPDWDMFHSLHASAELHAAARAIGGCPVYVSDVPGQHNATLLKKLVLPDGSLLRAQLPGRPTRDCLFADVGQDGTSALKIWNENKAGGGVVGAFHVQGVAWNFDTNENEVLNLDPPPITASVKPYDVESLRKHDSSFALWEHKSGVLHVANSGEESIKTSLTHRDWEIFTVVPIEEVEGVFWAPIGLGDMLNSGGALEHSSALDHTTVKNERTGELTESTTVDITTRGPGRFVAYCQPAPSSIIVYDGQSSQSSFLQYSHDTEKGLLSFELPEEKADKQPHQVTVVWD